MRIISTVLMLILLGCTTLLHAQVALVNQEDLLEFFYLSNENATEADGQLFMDLLEALQEDPMDLNTVTLDQLTETKLVSPHQAQALLQYREQFKPILNVLEIQAVPGWDADDVRRLMPFVQSGNLDATERLSLKDIFTKGKNDLIVRYLPANRSLPDEVEGGKHGMAIRLRHNYGQRVRYGFIADNDPGEAFFSGSNKQGFDYYGFYFFLRNKGNKYIKAVALGDFTPRLGQGLLLYPGFAFGKNSGTINVMRGGASLNPYTAFGEGLAFRGAGTTIALSKKLELTAFAAYTKRDANLTTQADTIAIGDDEVFTSLQTSGFHRTSSEIEDERSIAETSVGASLEWRNRTTEIGLHSVYFSYSKPWSPSEAPYRKFVFRGDRLFGSSVSYKGVVRNIIWFGETAMSDNRAWSSINGIILSPDRRVNVALVYRHFNPEYQALYAAPFAENSTATNERGLYLGVEVRPKKGWVLNMYGDVWRHPWLRFGVDLPSTGHDVLARITHTKRRKYTTYLQIQSKTRAQNAPSELNLPGLLDNTRTVMRLHGEQILTKTISFRNRVELNIFTYENQPSTQGYLAYQEVVFKKPLSPFTFSTRYGIFDSPANENRIYTFEYDVTAAISVPSFSGRGSRFVFNARWQINRRIALEGRISRTYLTKTTSETTPLGSTVDGKVQLRFKF